MLECSFQPFPRLETERLVLRNVDMSDVQALFDLRSDLQVMRYIGKPRPSSPADMEELVRKITTNILEGNGINWGMSLKDDPLLIGMIGYHRIEKEHFRAEIGYMLSPAHWRKGLMNEAITAVLEYGFSRMGLHSIEARINPDNKASGALLEKQGFEKEACFRENYFFNGKFTDTEVYSLLKS